MDTYNPSAGQGEQVGQKSSLVNHPWFGESQTMSKEEEEEEEEQKGWLF